MSQTEVVHSTSEHGACENCRTPLQGHYCHGCGQSAHNPLKNFGHAVEEVFESFWHLDGRIFRTLRDLLVPGRIAVNFLKGQRVGYVQPLRLFVILTLFTFFVGKLTLHSDDFGTGNNADQAYAKAQTVAEVEATRAAQVAQLEQQQKATPAAAAAFAVAMAAVNTSAAQRRAELEAQAAPSARSATDSALARANDAADRVRAEKKAVFINVPVNGKPWDAETNPIVLEGWPKFVSNWLNRRLANGQANVDRMGNKTDLYVQAILTSLPGALFFLMPIFALVLRLAYITRRPMGYLEHLVVALYSHARLLTALLLGSLASIAAAASGIAQAATAANVLSGVLWLAVPVSLWRMQRRVHGGLLLHRLRFATTGSVYGVLVLLATLYAMLASLTA